MTEGEFQEFLITVGYRYNSRTRTGFNTFEGFHTIVHFLEQENRYTFVLDAISEDTVALTGKLKAFFNENKNFLAHASYKDKRIRLQVRMTVDSDIDRDHLKEVVRFLIELCKSGLITPVCRICGKNRKTGIYIIGIELTPICDRCITRKQRQYEHRRDMFIKKKQNMPAGMAGALFGALLGASLYVLLYQFWAGYGIWAGLIVTSVFCGFVVTGKRATRRSAVICEILAFLTLLVAEYAATVANMAILIERNGGGIAVTEAIEIANTSLSNYSIINTIIFELLIGTGVMALIGILYFIKRSVTRPNKISKNLL